MEAGLCGPERDAKNLGRLGHREPQVVVQDDEGAPVRRQTPKGGLEEVAIGQIGRRVGDCRDVERRHLDLDDSTSLAAYGVEALANHLSVEPGVESVRV